MAHTPTRAAIYLRISRDDQATGLAVERQREDCEAIIARRGWTIAGEYVDNAVSASKRTVSRPAYDRLVHDFERGAFDALVCYDLDRLTRQPVQLEAWITSAEERGVVIVTANGEADLATDDGRLFARMKAAVARSEIERKGARQKRANLQRAQAGRPAPTRRRYGYETDGVTPRPSEAAFVRRMFDDFAAGVSIRAIGMQLVAEGVDPAPGRGWPHNRVRYILMSPFYAGRTVHNGIEAESAHVVPIVSADLSAHVRALLADEARRTSPGPKPKHILSGIATCGAVHDGVTCGRGLRRLGAADRQTYVCQIATKGHVSILREVLERRVFDEIATAILTGGPSLFAGTGDRAEIARLMDRLGKNDAATTATMRDRDEGLASPTVARGRLIELRAERQTIESALDRARIESAVSATLVESALALLVGDVMTLTEWAAAKQVVIERFLALALDRQREIVRALVAVEVAPGRDARTRVHVAHLMAANLEPDAVDPQHLAD